MPPSERRVQIAPDDPYRALGKSTLVFFLGSFASRAISFVLLPVLTPHLTPAAYGNIDIVMTTILISIPLLSMNVAEALFRFTLESRKTSAIGSASFLIGAGAILAFSIGVAFVKLPAISFARIPIILVFAGSLYTGMLKNLARSERRLGVYTISDIIYSIVFVGTGWYFVAVREDGLRGYLLAQALSLGAELVFMRLSGVRFRLFQSKLAEVGRAIRPLLRYSLPLIPGSLSWWIVFASGRYLISAMIGMAATGLFAVAYKIPSVLATAQGVFYQAWQVESIDRYGKKSSDAFYSQTFTYFVCANVAGVLLIAPFLSLLIHNLTAPAYWTAWQFVPLLMMATVFSAFSGFFGVGYLVMKRTGGALRTSLLGAAVNIILNLLLIPPLGIQGAGAAMLVANLVTWLARVYETRHILKVRIRWRRLALGIGLCIASLACAYDVGMTIPYSIPVQTLCILTWLLACRKDLVRAVRWCVSLMRGRKSRVGAEDRILFISNKMDPLNSGAAIHSRGIVERLRGHTVDVLAYGEPSSPQREWAHQDVSVRVIARKKSILRFLFFLFRFGSTPFSLQTGMKNALLNALRIHEYSLILFDHLASFSEYFRCQRRVRRSGARVVLVEHNIEHQTAHRQLRASKGLLLRTKLMVVSLRLKAFERKAVRAADEVWAISGEDAATLSNLSRQATRVKVCEPWYPFPRLKSEESLANMSRKLIFLGNLWWFPNSIGILWFLDKVFPTLRKIDNRYRLCIVGGATVDSPLGTLPEGVELHTNVFNVDPFIHRSDLLVVPVFHDCGVKIKIMEGIQKGIPVITTTAGSTGYRFFKDWPQFVANDPSAFADAILLVNEDAELKRSFMDSARRELDDRRLWNV